MWGDLQYHFVHLHCMCVSCTSFLRSEINTQRVCHGYFNSADRKDTETVGGQMSVAEFDSILYIQTDEYTSGPEACVEIVLDKEEYPVEL